MLRVAPAVIDNVRSMGRVELEFETESDWGSGTQVTNELVINVGAAGGREALDEAAVLLKEREWIVVAENRPTIVLMKSSRWKDVRVIVRPFHSAYFEDNPEILKRLERASVEEQSLVYLQIFEEPQA